MDCCKTLGVESLFDEKLVGIELRRYRRKGPDRTTRLLIQAIEKEGVSGKTLIDIGGGVGAITHALLASGVRKAVIVDASRPSLDAARQVAQDDATLDRLKLIRGDYVDLASSIGQADIVTLDRVICCYEDMPALVEGSAGSASRLYGVVYPRDTWWIRLAIRLLNMFQAVRHHPYRAYIHRTREVEKRVLAAGLKRRYHSAGLYWQVSLYSRA
jgi:hypothetical protein